MDIFNSTKRQQTHIRIIEQCFANTHNTTVNQSHLPICGTERNKA